MGFGRPEISVYQDLQTLKMVANIYKGIDVKTIQKDQSLAKLLLMVKTNWMAAKVLGPKHRDQFERTYQYEVFGIFQTVILPPWQQKVVDDWIEKNEKQKLRKWLKRNFIIVEENNTKDKFMFKQLGSGSNMSVRRVKH